MSLCQAAILAPVPLVARYLFFSMAPEPEPAQALRDSLRRLLAIADGTQVLVGLGPELVAALGADVPGLHPFEALSGHGDLTGYENGTENPAGEAAQEDFEPDAVVLRRAMPWAQGQQAEQEDGITDALFCISQPVNDAFFWCPPLRAGRLAGL